MHCAFRAKSFAHLLRLLVLVVALAPGSESSLNWRDIGFAPSSNAGSTCLVTLNSRRFPYLASLRQPGSRAHICNGVLISEDFVLTSAHCIDETSSYSAVHKPILHIGATNIDEVNDDVEVVLVSESYLHPCWEDGHKPEFDLALLKLRTPSDKPYPIVLFGHYQIQTGQQLAMAGWDSRGEKTGVGANNFGSVMLEMLEFVKQQSCNRRTSWNKTIPKGIFCAVNEEQKSSCIANSGAPLLLLDQPRNTPCLGKPEFDFLVGINVDGGPCGMPWKPDLFIVLENNQSWIMDRISKQKAHEQRSVDM